MSSSGTPPSPKKTTFLTSDPRGRPPSAYHVASDGVSQRARQGHGDGSKGTGATLTTAKHAVHAFTPDKATRDVVRANVKDSVARGIDTQTALRMEIMDGLASPTAQHGNAHQEAFPGFGTTHKSGGFVSFPQPGSGLANFDAVAQRAQARKHNGNIPPIQDTQSTQHTRESTAFNTQALQEQRTFARGLLTPK